MRLQRIGIYRLTRVLSWVLPVVIAAFVVIAAWSYRSRIGDAQPLIPTPDELPPDQVVRSDGLKYVVSEGDRDQFQVRASQMLVSKDNRSLLKDVEILIYAQKAGEADRRIRGDECSHDKQTGRVICNHHVSVELEPGTIAYTEKLSYESANGLISSNVDTALRREGEMTGHSAGMQYFVNDDLMRLTGHFEMELVQGGRLRGGIAVFQKRENRVTVSQGVEFESANGRILGGSGHAELLPGTYRPRQITVENSAAAEAPSFAVNSEWLRGDLSDAGSITHVLGRGNVDAEYNPGGGSQENSLSGTLKGPEVEAWLENGRVTAVEARQHPDFVGESGTLKAERKIRIEPEDLKSGALRTEGVSNFEGDTLTIDGRDFLMTVQEGMQIFDTALRATLKFADLTTHSDRTEARLDTKTRKLISVKQSGNVTFEEDKGGRSGSAAEIVVADGGDRIELEDGDPRFTDGQNTLHARRITFDRQSGSFTGDGNVLVANAETGEQAVVILAEHVDGGENRVDYTGDVQMFPGDGKVEAGHLTLFPNENRFTADGGVHSQISGLDVRAGTLEVRDSGENQQIAHYTGDVQARKTDSHGGLELQAQDLNVHLKNGEIDTVDARHEATMTQGLKKGRADRVEYNVTTGDILLVGTNSSEAEVFESDQFVKGCSIQIMADGRNTAKPCPDGSVTSSVKIKK